MIITIMASQKQSKIRVVIVGGGFGGVRAARQLAKNSRLHVTLISNHHHFAYYPQFYHSATGGSRSESALDLTAVLAGTGVELVHDAIMSVNVAAHEVVSAGRHHYTYDQLVLALGSVTNYFGITGLEKYSFDIKTIDGAQLFKRHLHRQILAGAAGEHTFAVVGGGPTGVELAASLGSYLRYVAHQHGLPVPKFKVDLIEAGARVLPRQPEAFAKRVQKRLRSLGVTVLTGTAVEAETAKSLLLSSREINTSSVVWTAGAANHPFYADNADQFQLAKNGKVVVDGHLQAAPEVYVIGDNADTPYAGYAQTAIRDANFVAQDLGRKLAGHHRPTYKPWAPANVIPVGPHWAAAQWGPFTLYGYAGYILRRLADLIGYADIERWPAALRVWLGDGQTEAGCRSCELSAPALASSAK